MMRGMLILGAAWCAAAGFAGADEGEWTVLTDSLAAWQDPDPGWTPAGGAHLDPDNPRRLVAEPGTGAIVNQAGPVADLVSRQSWSDVELQFEFMVPKGSNSGVKLHRQYEIQITDSAGKEPPSAEETGGIYPRAELLPIYHHIDEGFAPRVNAAQPAGQWQTLEIVFRSPRFNEQGEKTANARFNRVVLNGQVIHENVEVPYPTGHAWHNQETSAGPLLFQGDHGPVAFRNVRIRELETSE